MNIIYAGKMTDTNGGQISYRLLKEVFEEAITLHKKLITDQRKIAYFFIDPLLHSFEAANEFYFSVFECESIEKCNTYKSGASPIQALADAEELIKNGLYDAVLIFGHELLLTNRKLYGKDEVTKAMSLFENHSIIQCYHEMARTLGRELELTEHQLIDLFDQLFGNYHKTYKQLAGDEVSSNRGRRLDVLGADLFKLTDCANPNIDFSGGIILVNEDTAQSLSIAEENQIKVRSARYSMMAGSPENIHQIVGQKNRLFPHLQKAFFQVQHHSRVQMADEWKNRNLFLEVYTCYPPVPIAFLLSTGMIADINELPDFLAEYEITITGGMNFAKAPWNNPALNAVIGMVQKLKENTRSYGLVHGNGGIGEIQGVVLLEK